MNKCPECNGSTYYDEEGILRCEECGWYETHKIKLVQPKEPCPNCGHYYCDLNCPGV